MENDVQIIKAEIMNLEDYAMGPENIIKQVSIIQSVMKKVMQDGQHYGTIPGCGDKPTLLKPGAEKLTMTFRLAPKFHITERDLGKGHREYEVQTELISIVTGGFIGEGLGSCSTMESKYRFRNAEPEITDQPVPQAYWNLRKAGSPKAQEMLGGSGFTTKKTDEGWFIAKKSGDRVEHDNPADYYNTCLKMAKKRSLVDATLTATAASDIFTQDIEDMAFLTKDEPKSESKTEPKKETQKKPKMDFPFIRSELERISGSGEAWDRVLSTLQIESYGTIKDDAKKKKQLWDRLNIELDKCKKNQVVTVPCPERDGDIIEIDHCNVCELQKGCPSHEKDDIPY